MNLRVIHVATTKSYRAGADPTPLECAYCGHKTAFVSYVSLECDTCGADSAWENDIAGQLKAIRVKSGISRRDLAQVAGLKTATIRTYECVWPSKAYYNWFLTFIRQHYKGKTT